MAKRLFDPASSKPFALSRSKVSLFMECPRCFYLDGRLGIARPPGFPFNLNSAVDGLLKKEFDSFRSKGEPHPLMRDAGLNAVPHIHPQLDTWRSNFKGVRTVHQPTGLELFGAIDDLWRDLGTGELIVVDYKATSKDAEVTLDAEWQDGYKRQMEFYQWLLRRQGFAISQRGWFVYCNGRRDLDAFNNRLEFRVKMIPYEGDDAWVEPVLMDVRKSLDAAEPPPPEADCAYCAFADQATKA
jgi:CRISPR/Cas system-associated exonuclease Cas4 (RecB family)